MQINQNSTADGGAMPSLGGSRITFLAYDREGRFLHGQNAPADQSLPDFAALVARHRMTVISERTFGDVIRTLGRTGGTAREQCDVIGDGFEATYHIDLWQQEDGSVGVMLVDMTGQDSQSSSVRSLSLELAHRTKNVLAVILSLANQTANRSRDYPQFKRRFFAHVDALSTAHDMIAATGWQGVAVRQVMERCVDPKRRDTALRVGPPADIALLTPNAVQNVAIVIRELQAASAEGGTISCEIAEAEEGALDLSWSCQGHHDRDGLWTDMLCRFAPTALAGSGDLEFDEEGFRYRLRIGANQRA